jgi:hypothetical protein
MLNANQKRLKSSKLDSGTPLTQPSADEAQEKPATPPPDDATRRILCSSGKASNTDLVDTTGKS